MNKWLSPLLHASGYFEREWRRHADQRGFAVVLCYHRVATNPARSGFLTVERGVAPDVFEAQIRFMRQHFDPVLPRDLHEDLSPGRPRFAVTFDDGYEDNATVAAPILERLGVKGAFYVVTEFAGTDRRFWWERVAAMLRATGRRAVDVQAIFPSAQGDAHAEARALPLSTDEQRDRAHATLCDRMRPLPPEALDAALVQLQEHLGVEVPEAGRDFPLMGWDRLRELDRRGHEVGCHSASHANLRTAAPAIVRREILTARDRIAGELGAAPRTFAYPYGYWGPYAADVIREAGFSLAFAEGSGVVDARAALHALPRVGLNRRWPFAVTYNIHRALATAS